MIQALERLFIRPSRHYYRAIDLGPERIKVKDSWAYRKDTSILNKNGRKILLSAFLFNQLQKTDQIIIYCHCNSGSKIQGIGMVKNVLEMGIAFLVFDFTGSGLSQGDYITLGLNESQDLQAVVQYVKSLNPKIKIGLWGRSMGSVACLLYAYKNPSLIQVGVYDSPFSNLRQLCVQIGVDKTRIPKLILQGLANLFNQRLKQKIKDNLFQRLDISKIVDNIILPGLFLGSRNDSLIPFTHIELLYEKYGGYKQIYYLQQDHHQKRLDETINYALKFISKRLKVVRHKKSCSNIVSKDKHHVSHIDIRYSFQNKKKLELSYLTARKKITSSLKDNTFNEANNTNQNNIKQSKKKFIHLTQLPKENKAPKKIKLVKSTLKPNKKPNLKLSLQQPLKI